MPRPRPNVSVRRGAVPPIVLALLAAACCAACGDTAVAAPDRRITGYADGVVSTTTSWQGRPLALELAVQIGTTPNRPGSPITCRRWAPPRRVRGSC